MGKQQAAQAGVEAGTLKPGWRLVKFGDVVKLSTQRCSDPVSEGIERYVGLEHIDSDDLRIRRWGLVEDGITFTTRFKPGQVLFGKRRAYLRKVAVPDFAGICSGDIYVFESVDPKVLLPELLPFICQTERFIEYAIGTSAGSLSPRTNWKSLVNFEFALPPLDEQKRISEAFKALRLARNALETARQDAEKVRFSLLVGVFSKLEDSGNCYLKSLNRSVICHRIKVEQAGDVLMGRQLSPKYKKGLCPYPYLRVANVFDGYIDTTNVNEMDFSESELKVYRLQSGDVLLNEGQSRELVGRSAIFRDEIENCCFQNTLIRFRPIEAVMSEYAHHYFQYCLYTGRFIKVSKQTTSIAHLGVQRFAKMEFPLIERDDQKAIVELMSAINQVIDDIKMRLALIQNMHKVLGMEKVLQYV